MIPTNKDAELTDRGVDRLKAEIAGSKIEFLIKTRIVGNVHLAIFACDGAIRIKDHSSVVVKPRRPFFKKGRDYDDMKLRRKRREIFSGRPGDRLREIKHCRILSLTKIWRVVKLLEDNQLGPFPRKRYDAAPQLLNIIGDRSTGGLLYEPDIYNFRHFNQL